MSPDGSASRNAFGQPMRRKEDVRLLLGQGRFTADLLRPGMAHAVMIRSPHAHAAVMAIDAAAAAAMPGVLAVLTGAEYAADGLGGITRIMVRDRDVLEPRALEGTDGGDGPFFSPDGEWIGYFADGKLFKVPASGGGPPAQVAEGAIPIPPISPAARSDRMSPNIFSVTITSNVCGRWTRYSAIAST